MSRITLIVVVVEVALAAVGLVVGWWIGTPILQGVRVDLLSGVLALAATLPLVAVVFWGLRAEFAVSVRFRELMRETVLPLFEKCSTLEILLISIMAGVGEEVFFRGFLQGSLGRVVHPWIALALVSALFGLAHYVSLGYAIVAGLLGAYIGTLWLVTGNLFVAIAVHAWFDFAALLYLSRMKPSPASEPGLP